MIWILDVLLRLTAYKVIFPMNICKKVCMKRSDRTGDFILLNETILKIVEIVNGHLTACSKIKNSLHVPLCVFWNIRKTQTYVWISSRQVQLWFVLYTQALLPIHFIKPCFCSSTSSVYENVCFVFCNVWYLLQYWESQCAYMRRWWWNSTSIIVLALNADFHKWICMIKIFTISVKSWKYIWEMCSHILM